MQRYAVVLSVPIALLLAACQQSDTTGSGADPDAAARVVSDAPAAPVRPTPPEPKPDDLSPRLLIMRLHAEAWPPELGRAFSLADYPSLKAVLEGFAVLHENPSDENYEQADGAMDTFESALTEDDYQTFYDAADRVMRHVNAGVQVWIAEAIAETLERDFPEADYPEMQTLKMTTNSFARNPSEETYGILEDGYKLFLDSLNTAERARALDVESGIREVWDAP